MLERLRRSGPVARGNKTVSRNTEATVLGEMENHSRFLLPGFLLSSVLFFFLLLSMKRTRQNSRKTFNDRCATAQLSRAQPVGNF